MELKVKDYHSLVIPELRNGKFADGRRFDLNDWLNTEEFKVVDYVDNAQLKKLPGLSVTVESTASDVIINRRAYTADSVMAAHKSFLGKPVLRNHDSGGMFGPGEVLGRIVDSKFEKLLSGTEFTDAKHNPARQLDGRVVGVPSGRVINELRVSDKSAIQEIKDGRALTFSQGARAKSAVCNICGQDWLKDGYCEHSPGEEYKVEVGPQKGRKRPAHLMMDISVYDELSIVAIPAWQNAVVLSVGDETELTDSARETEARLVDALVNNCPDFSKQSVAVCEIVLYDNKGNEISLMENGLPIKDHIHEVNTTNTESEMDNSQEIAELQKSLRDATAKIAVLEERAAESKAQLDVKDSELQKLKDESQKLSDELKALGEVNDSLSSEIKNALAASVIDAKRKLGVLKAEDAEVETLIEGLVKDNSVRDLKLLVNAYTEAASAKDSDTEIKKPTEELESVNVTKDKQVKAEPPVVHTPVKLRSL